MKIPSSYLSFFFLPRCAPYQSAFVMVFNLKGFNHFFIYVILLGPFRVTKLVLFTGSNWKLLVVIIVMIIKEWKGSYQTILIVWIPGMAPTLTKALIMICASAKDHSWWLHTSLALVLQAKPWECLSIYAENPVIKKN